MVTKLVISELDVRSRYVTREAYHVMKALIDDYGWHHLESQALMSQPSALRQRMRERCGITPDVVLFWEAYNVINAAFLQIFNAEFRVVVFCDDLHWFHEHVQSAKMLAMLTSDIILASYAPVFERFFPQVASEKRIVWVPHAASPEFMLPMNEQAENKILLSGKIDRHYPLRQQLTALADEADFRIVEHPHPGYQCRHDHVSSAAVGSGYARRINQFRAAFTDASQFNYVLAKYFEIPATGCLLLGDAAVENELSELGFRSWVHFVPVSARTLEDELRYILDVTNHDKLDEIRRTAQQLVRERHKTCDRAKLINEVCVAS